MNFLAHFHLARTEPELMVGALLGDFVKGPLKGHLPPRIESGIALHRRIDVHTDHFVQNRNLHEHFHSSYRRYLGIMLDLYFDYLLTHNWPDFEQHSLSDFAASTIAILSPHKHRFPDKGLQFFLRMEEHQLLEKYGDEVTQQSILERLSLRLPGTNPLASCWNEMQAKRDVLEPAFVQLYTELQTIEPPNFGQ